MAIRSWREQQPPHEQLPMFMSAREIMTSHQVGEGERGLVRLDASSTRSRVETEEETMDRKLKEANQPSYNFRDRRRLAPHEQGGESLTSSVLREGVTNPVQLSTSQFGDRGMPEILNGHHRLAVMNEHRPDALLPVLHHRDLDSWVHAVAPEGYDYS